MLLPRMTPLVTVVTPTLLSLCMCVATIRRVATIRGTASIRINMVFEVQLQTDITKKFNGGRNLI